MGARTKVCGSKGDGEKLVLGSDFTNGVVTEMLMELPMSDKWHA